MEANSRSSHHFGYKAERSCCRIPEGSVCVDSAQGLTDASDHYWGCWHASKWRIIKLRECHPSPRGEERAAGGLLGVYNVS